MSIKTLFENQKAMKVFAILALISGIAVAAIFYVLDGGLALQQPIYLIQGVLAIFLYRAYAKHDKNVMKGLMGALLTELILNELCYLFGFFTVRLGAITEISSLYAAVFIALEVIYFGLALALFIDHFVINSDHHSSPKLVRLNRILLIALLITIVAQEVCNFFALGEVEALSLLSQIVWFVLEVSTYAVIVCIESKLDAFRIKRESE